MQSLDVISVNIWQIVISLANLALLFLLLKKFLYQPVKRMLAKEFEGKVILIDYAPLVFLEYEKTFDAAIAGGMTRDEALTHLRATYNANETDPTHQNAVGANLAAEKILSILRSPDFVCPLKDYLA